jgi:hypothetical protein
MFLIKKATLEENGLFQVDTFYDAESALAIFRPDHYDLAVLDIRMPKMNGFQLCRKLREIDKKLKICFLTAVELLHYRVTRHFPLVPLSFHRFTSIIFIFTVFFGIDVSLTSPSEYNAFAHMPVSNTSRVQEWTDHYSGISTLFVYEPEKPVIDTFTELNFSFQNTTTGNHLSDTDNAKARVVVTNGQRLFKFENITVEDNGHFL